MARATSYCRSQKQSSFYADHVTRINAMAVVFEFVEGFNNQRKRRKLGMRLTDLN